MFLGIILDAFTQVKDELAEENQTDVTKLQPDENTRKILDQVIGKAFEQFDTNGDGQLDTVELTSFFNLFAEDARSQLGATEVSQLIRELDSDGDLELSATEVADWVWKGLCMDINVRRNYATLSKTHGKINSFLEAIIDDIELSVTLNEFEEEYLSSLLSLWYACTKGSFKAWCFCCYNALHCRCFKRKVQPITPGRINVMPERALSQSSSRTGYGKGSASTSMRARKTRTRKRAPRSCIGKICAKLGLGCGSPGCRLKSCHGCGVCSSCGVSNCKNDLCKGCCTVQLSGCMTVPDEGVTWGKYPMNEYPELKRKRRKGKKGTKQTKIVGKEEKSVRRKSSTMDENDEAADITKSNSTMILAVSLVIGYLTLGILFYTHQEGWSVVDALYFSFVTLTTVGYGDLGPTTDGSKMFTAVFVFCGIGLIGGAIGILASYILDKQEQILRNAIQDDDPSDDRFTPGQRKLIISTLLLFLVVLTATVIFAHTEELSTIDAFYLTCISLTTVGYGDISPKSESGRIAAIPILLIGTFIVAKALGAFVDTFLEAKQAELVARALNRKLSIDDLAKGDRNSDGKMSEAEFILFKLERMNKLDLDSVRNIENEFRKVDIDHSGELTMDEVKEVLGLQ